jgi:hypothetical protein
MICHTSSSRPAFQQSVRTRAKMIIVAGHKFAILSAIDVAFAAASVANDASVVLFDLWTTADIFASLEIRPMLDCQQKDFAGYRAVEFGSRLAKRRFLVRARSIHANNARTMRATLSPSSSAPCPYTSHNAALRHECGVRLANQTTVQFVMRSRPSVAPNLAPIARQFAQKS